MYSSKLKYLENWYLPTFHHKEGMHYQIETELNVFDFTCHAILSSTQEHTALYGEAKEVSRNENCGYKAIFVNKVTHEISMHHLPAPIPEENLKDKAMIKTLAPFLQIGVIPTSLNFFHA